MNSFLREFCGNSCAELCRIHELVSCLAEICKTTNSVYNLGYCIGNRANNIIFVM